MKGNIHQMSSVPTVSTSQIVVVVGWFMVASFVVATGVRLGTKLSMKRQLGIDDGLIILATILGISQMVPTFIQALLAKTETPTGAKWDNFQKAFFTSQLLFIPAVCTAKLSILHSLHQLSPVREHKTIITGFAILVGVLLVTSEFSAGLQCSSSQWKILSGSCFDQIFGVVDIITDVLIAMFPTYIVCNLQMGPRFKRVIATIFATRLSTTAASLARLIYLSRSHVNLQTSPYAFWMFILSTEIEQGLSIITACIPFLKPFFEALDTGMLAPSHGLGTVKSNAGSKDRSKRSQNSESATELNDMGSSRESGAGLISGGIQVSRRISTHSEKWEWDKDGGRAWAQAVAAARNSQA